MSDPIIPNASGDVITTISKVLKCRTKEIVIRNQDPNAKRLDVYESLQFVETVDGVEKLGSPLVEDLRSIPVDSDLLTREIGGVTGAQVLTYIAALCAEINSEDMPKMAGRIGVTL